MAAWSLHIAVLGFPYMHPDTPGLHFQMLTRRTRKSTRSNACFAIWWSWIGFYWNFVRSQSLVAMCLLYPRGYPQIAQRRTVNHSSRQKWVIGLMLSPTPTKSMIISKLFAPLLRSERTRSDEVCFCFGKVEVGFTGIERVPSFGAISLAYKRINTTVSISRRTIPS